MQYHNNRCVTVDTDIQNDEVQAKCLSCPWMLQAEHGVHYKQHYIFYCRLYISWVKKQLKKQYVDLKISKQYLILW